MMRIKGRTGFPANSFSLEKNAGKSDRLFQINESHAMNKSFYLKIFFSR